MPRNSSKVLESMIGSVLDVFALIERRTVDTSYRRIDARRCDDVLRLARNARPPVSGGTLKTILNSIALSHSDSFRGFRRFQRKRGSDYIKSVSESVRVAVESLDHLLKKAPADSEPANWIQLFCKEELTT